MKFIHAADIHLDSPLRGLAAYPEAPALRLRMATREAFERLVTFAIEEAIDFLVIAGDLYDGGWRDFNTGLYFVKQMGRLRKADIPVYLLYGNHDAESEMTKTLELPDNVHVFPASKAGTFRIDDLQVALHGRSFKVAATTENLASSYPAPVPGWLNIGVLHTALEGNAAHATYAPCSIAELDVKGYQYWALGHVHEQWIRQGDVTIAYPGNLQGRHIRETGAKGVLLVSADAGEIQHVESISMDVLRWHELGVDLSAASDIAAAVHLVGNALQCLLEQTDSELTAVRVVLTGQSDVHTLLIANQTQLRQEILAQAVALDADRLWIEKVLVSTTPNNRINVSADAVDALSDLQVFASQAGDDTEFMADLRAELQQMLDKLPAELLNDLPELQALRSGELGKSLVAASELLMARIEQVG